MAAQHKQEGPSGSSFDLASTVGQKVVRLPTAAKRQVPQHLNRETRAAMVEARKEWPGEYILPTVRDAACRIRELDEAPTTPETELVRSLLQGGPESALIARVMEIGAEEGDPFAETVVSMLNEMIGVTLGEQYAFTTARQLISEGRA